VADWGDRPPPPDPATVPVPILYQDQALVVVAKPSGLAVHRGLASDSTFALQRVRDLVGRRVQPVHRLDRATSGALVMALSAEAARGLHQQFAARTVSKRYLCLVRGHPPAEGVIDSPLPKEDGGPGVPAVTRFRVLQTIERAAWVEVTPETGRYHQIRKHLRRLDHPLVGDVSRGDGRVNRLFRRRCGLWRLALHACEIGFDHPLTGERQVHRCPLPPDLLGPLDRLGVRIEQDPDDLGTIGKP